MNIIYEMDASGRLTGNTRSIGEYDGAPVGWTFAMPPTKDYAAWQWSGGRYIIYVEPPLQPVYVPDISKLIVDLMTKVDDTVATVILKMTRFAMGYEQREAAAKAFKEAGYEGDPTIWVSRFAGNTGMSFEAATDLILAQADHLRDALEALEALRMDKYKIKASTDEASAYAAYNSIITSVQAIAKTL